MKGLNYYLERQQNLLPSYNFPNLNMHINCLLIIIIFSRIMKYAYRNRAFAIVILKVFQNKTLLIEMSSSLRDNRLGRHFTRY